MVRRSLVIHLAGALGVVLCAHPVGGDMRATDPSPYPREAVAPHTSPAWSPDDRRIAYMTMPGHPGTLLVVPSSGGPPARLFEDDGQYATPAWSRDGSRLAFASQRSGTWTIWTSAPDGTEARPATPSLLAQVFAPDWSPDGKQIAFSAITAAGPVIMTVPAGGGTPARLRPGWRPRWSPDGTRIAFTERFTEAGRDLEALAVLTVSDGASRRLTAVVRDVSTPHLATDWSPDGRRLVATRRAGPHCEILSIDVASDTSSILATVDGFAEEPTWSHDGGRIAYSSSGSDHAGEIHVLSVASGSAVALTLQPHGARARLVEYPAADGTRIPAWLREPLNRRGRVPALVWVHGGAPGEGRVDDGYDDALQYVVSQGYVVLQPNYRGSAGYGADIARFPGPDEVVADLVAAGDYLRTLPSVDPARIGIVGFSAGGFWTASALVRAPQTFRAGVDFFGPTDLVRLHQTSPTQRPTLNALLGPIEGHEEAYRQASPIAHADSIAVPVLVIHGDGDRVIPVDQSIQFVGALRAAGKAVEFVHLRGGHGFEGEEQATAFESVARFFANHLQR